MVLQQVSKIGDIVSPTTLASIVYHNIFEYPLSSGELIKWEVSPKLIKPYHLPKDIGYQKGFYFINGQEGLLLKRALRKRLSEKKQLIAKKSVRILSLIPWITGVFLTGSVAMGNAKEEGDIDLMIIVKSGRLWTSRLLSFLLLTASGFKMRRHGIVDQKDRLCMNMWLDESSLVWPEKERNIFSAHEIIQVKPLLNRRNVYERFLSENIWVKDYWPSSISINKRENTAIRVQAGRIEKMLFNLQHKYMKDKITKEIVREDRAIFHPTDLWPEILRQLRGKGFKL